MGTFDNLFAKASPTATATPATGGTFDNLFPSKQTENPTVGTQDWNGQKIPADIPTKNLVAYDPTTGNKTFNLGNAAQGVYTEDKNGNIVKGGHTTYGGVLPVKGSQRDDIIPQGLGGTNANAGNIKLVPDALASQQDKVETQLSQQVKSKQIQPKAAIPQALRDKADLASNFFAPPDPTSTPASILKPEIPLNFQVGAGLDAKGQQNAKAQIIREEQMGAQPIPQTPSNMDVGKGVKDILRATPRAVAETTMSLFPAKMQQPIEPITQSPFFRFLMGDDTLKPLAQQAVETEANLKQQGFGKASTPLAVLGVATNDAIALTPLTAPLTKLANDAVAQLAKEASTKELTITFADAQKIVNGEVVDPVKLQAFKATAADHPDLLKAFSKDGGLTITKTEETPLSAFLKKAAGIKPQEGTTFSLPDNAPFAHELKPQAQLTTPKPEVAPFAHETPPPPEVKPFANEIKPVEAPKEYPTIHQGGVIKMVQGEPVKIVDGVETFLHKDENGNWVVSEATTGRDLSGGGYQNSTFAIKAAKANIENVGEAKFKQLIANQQLPKTETAITGISKDLQPLAQEAKKYKSAEDFIRANQKVFRGGKSNEVTAKGLSVSTSEQVAKEFALGRKGTVSELYISPGAKIVDIYEIPTLANDKAVLDYYQANPPIGDKAFSSVEDKYLRAVKWAKENGYDGVKLPTEGEIRIVNPEVIKTKSQLTDFYNKVTQKTETPAVQSKPTVEGQTPSKIGVSIEQKAVEQKLTQGFEGVAGYDKITIKDQAERATKLMSNPDEAMSVIRGEKPLPEGLRGTALITAAEEHIARTGDVKMAYELANSPLVSETSAAAQELRLAAERQPDGLTAKLQELKKAKEAAAQKRVGNLAKARTKIKSDIQGEIKAKTPKAKDWASFIEQIKCT